jgi:hypothetical protein
MIHSSIIIVYTYIHVWYFDYYSTVLSGKLAVATGHAHLIIYYNMLICAI